MTWRERVRPIVARVLAEMREKPEPEIRKALRDAYPFCERKYWPYRIWCDEVRVQRGGKTTSPHRTYRRKVGLPADPSQGELL